ncbi:Plasma membrane-associated cation-binding protein 1 [Ancistrocladus abbreviatus]
MDYWKTKVLPKIQKVFGKDASKKAAAAAEACKSFDDSKEEINKEFEEKKAELQPKVIEIYEASSTEIKSLIKEPKEAGLKKHSAKVQKLIDELVKIEFPGSKTVSEATSKFGPVLVGEPVIFIFEKVSTFVPTAEDVEATAPATTSREVVIEAAKGKELAVEAEKAESSSEQPTEAAAAQEEPGKVVEEPAKLTEEVEAPAPAPAPALAAEPPNPAEVVEPTKVEAPAAEPSKPTEAAPTEPPKA